MGFASFLVRRILLGIVVLWFVTVATFLLFFVAPQDPARLLAGKNTTAAQIANINRRLGLDQGRDRSNAVRLARLRRIRSGLDGCVEVGEIF